MKTFIKTFAALLVVLLNSSIFADDTSNTNTTTTVTTTPSGQLNSNTPPSTATTNTSTTTIVNGGDDKIVTIIYSKYAKDPALIGTNLNVTCVDGIVTISGTVVSQSQADEAVIAAKSVAGVKDARSSINVTTNPATNTQSPKPNY